jgi:hypothetical protein
MKALTKILAGGVFVAALVSAAPAAAQYYPGYGNPGYGYGGGANVIGQVLSQVLGGGYGGYGNNGYGYGNNSQAAVNQCAAAVQQRLGGGYGGYGYNGGYGGGRVLGVSSVEPRSSGGLTVRGVASSGQSAGYAYGGQGQADLTFKCKVDYRGYVSSVDLNRTNYYGSNYNQYNQYNPYSAYGYRRY